MVPTFTEKLLHKPAEHFDLSIHEVKKIRIGALICWEHWMPLARQYYHDQHEEIHLALWPSVQENHQKASRHYAFEGRCYVIAVGQLMDQYAIPKEIEMNRPNNKTPLLNGGSCVINPDGTYLLEPQFDKDEIIYVEIPDKSAILRKSLTMDVSGHYGRIDLFNFGLKY
jgi:predicted amidohydrolase